MAPLRIQIVEGNPHLRTLLSWHLRKAGYDVSMCGTIAQAKVNLKQQLTHLLVIDGDLPSGTGLEFCHWAYHQFEALILLLSSQDAEAAVIAGLQAGADDYVVKPLSMPVFLARVEALLRRLQRATPPTCLRFGTLSIDLVQRQVTLRDQVVELTPQEFSLLFVLAQSAGQALTRTELLQRAWPDAIDNPRTVDTHILSLRKKLEANPHQPQWLQTVRHVGYSFTPPGPLPAPQGLSELTTAPTGSLITLTQR